MNKKTILIVDDDLRFSRMVKLFLEMKGAYHVECESDPTTAVARARSIQPDAILLDLIMPKMDGAELKVEMDNDPFLRPIPKMFFTSNASLGDQSEGALVMTADGPMLPKTAEPSVVRRCVDEMIEGSLNTCR